jgi:hypothetical protein
LFVSSANANKIDLDIKKITAAWAFSESAFGGILHVLKIPFTGLFIGSAAVFFICLIAQLSKNKSEILRATLLVILVKAITSPFTPLNSYLAVILQGLLGYLLFKYLPNQKIAAIILGILALFLASMQKILVMTILFGTTIWESIDSVVRISFSFITNKEFVSSFSISLALIAGYTLLHLIAGIYVSVKSMRLDKWIHKKNEILSDYIDKQNNNFFFDKPQDGKGKKWWERKSGIVILTFFVIMMIMSYIFPQLGSSTSLNILFMLIRSIIITIIWFFIISPLLLRLFERYINSKRSRYTEQVSSITNLFPGFKIMISYAWNKSSSLTGIPRVKKFISHSLVLLLMGEI